MIKIVIIGVGFIGKTHASAYKQIENANIVAVVDQVEEKGQAFAKEFKTKFYKDLDEVLAKEDINIVDICTPTFLHKDMAIKAANAGKNIFCEKPLALSLSEADEIINIVNKNNVKSMVGHVLRFWPEYVEVKKIIDSGNLGKPMHFFCERLCVLPDWQEKKWGFNEKYSGGAALDLHIHDLDYLIWLFGKPKRLYSQGFYNPKVGGLGYIASSIEFKNGESGIAEGGWDFLGSFPFTMVLRILCEAGVIDWLFRAGKNIEERSSKTDLVVYKADGTSYIPKVEQLDPYYLECKYFVDCIDNDLKVERATLEDGRASLALALAASESAKNKKIIEF